MSVLAVAVVLSSVSCEECSGPGNAWAYPSSPMPVHESSCHYYQVFEAISPSTNYHPKCGYTVAFGPKGDLKHPADGYWLQADWGEVVPTAAECADSHTSAQAWGYRCEGGHCAQGEWERIENWKTRSGYWNSVSNQCYLGLGFTAVGANYNTVQVEVLAYRGSGTNKVLKRAKGHIYVFRHTGNCVSLPVPATPTSRHARVPPRPLRLTPIVLDLTHAG